MQQSIVVSGGQIQRSALGAKAAKVGWMILVTAYANDAIVFTFDDNAAAGSAVAAGRFGFCFHVG
jgi:hypothetical protein